MAPINIGFVGLSSAGWASVSLAPSIIPLKDKYKIVAVSTTTTESAAASAKKYGEQQGSAIKPYHGSTSAISADPDVDLVAVAVKVANHKEALTPILQAGKNVFIEWPAGLGLRETQAFAQLAKEKQVKSFVGFQGRFSPVIRKLKQIVEDGTIGKVLSTNLVAMIPKEALFWGPWVNENNKYTVEEAGGATMLDIAIGHALDPFTYALGPITSVSATTKTHYKTSAVVTAEFKPTGESVTATGADQVAFTGTLASGAVSTFHWRAGLSVATGTRPPFSWIIDGEKGSITITAEGPGGAFFHIYEPKIFLNGEPVETEDNGLGNIGRAWTAFADGTGDYASLDDALQIKKVLDAISRSGKEGRRIDIL